MIRFAHYRIRQYTKDDTDALHEILSDPQLMRYMEKTYTYEETAQFLNAYGLCAHPPVYALENEQSGMLAGHIIFHPYDENSYEIGWIIRKEEQGRGLASKVTEALIEYGVKSGIHVYVIECTETNAASIHLAETNGFVFERKDEDLRVYRKIV